MSRSGYPVKIRGVTYPSIKAAAEAVGVKPSTISTHLTRGTIDNAGKGRGYGAAHVTQNGECKPITLGNMHFPSRVALSRYLGKSDGYVTTALRTGQYHRIVRAFRIAVERDKRRA